MVRKSVILRSSMFTHGLISSGLQNTITVAAAQNTGKKSRNHWDLVKYRKVMTNRSQMVQGPTLLSLLSSSPLESHRRHPDQNKKDETVKIHETHMKTRLAGSEMLRVAYKPSG